MASYKILLQVSLPLLSKLLLSSSTQVQKSTKHITPIKSTIKFPRHNAAFSCSRSFTQIPFLHRKRLIRQRPALDSVVLELLSIRAVPRVTHKNLSFFFIAFCLIFKLIGQRPQYLMRETISKSILIFVDNYVALLASVMIQRSFQCPVMSYKSTGGF